MRLSDARKVAVKQNLRIRFELSGGKECVITEQGIARVPQLDGVPEFNLEEEFGRAGQFHLERLQPHATQLLTREQLASLLTPATSESAESDE